MLHRAPRLHRLGLLVALLTVLVACGGPATAPGAAPDVDPQGDVAVRPLDGIFVEEPAVELGEDGTSATIELRTTRAMACVVLYGTDPSFGQLALDEQMGAGAHSDHRVVLRGLEPGTEVVYRIQGSDVVGNLYRGELRRLTTPDVAAVETPGENVAPQADVADVSSEFSEGFAAAQAIDGDLATAWATDGDGDDAALTVDLGREVELAGIGVRTRSMTDGTAIIERGRLLVDGEEVAGPFDVSDGLTVVEVDAAGRTLTFEAIETAGGNTGLVELEIYEARS